MRWVDQRIAIGDASDALAIRKLEAAQITGVLSLDWFPLSAPSPQLEWRKHSLIDGPGNSVTAIEAAVLELGELLDRCTRVLVHCREGVSRSPFVVACYLAATSGRPLSEAIEELNQRIGWTAINEGLLESWDELAASGSNELSQRLERP